MNTIIKRNTILLYIVFLTALMIFSGCSKSTDPENSWLLVWSDEFDGTAGQLPSEANWDYDIGTDWGNNQLEYDTNRPENVSLDGNGNLVITARKESYMDQEYTSARIVTRGKYDPTYGRFEVRMKLPSGQGLWPAFWLLGSNISTVGWPQCGEIDIMEYRGQVANTIFGSLHGPGYSGGDAVSVQYTLDKGRFDTDFHVFAVEWSENSIKWYVDGINYLSIKPENLGGDEWVFNHPFFIILNVAVGGNFVGSPDASTVFPQTMVIDYVRVYQGG